MKYSKKKKKKNDKSIEVKILDVSKRSTISVEKTFDEIMDRETILKHYKDIIESYSEFNSGKYDFLTGDLTYDIRDVKGILNTLGRKNKRKIVSSRKDNGNILMYSVAGEKKPVSISQNNALDTIAGNIFNYLKA